MSPKRPPTRERPPVVKEWSPNDSQALRVRVDLAQETEWRRGVIDQIEPIAKTLGEVRDLARTNEWELTAKASKADLSSLDKRISNLATNVRWLRYLTIGVLVIGVLEKLAEKKGML